MIYHMGVLVTAYGLLRSREFFVVNMKNYMVETIPMMTAAEYREGQAEEAEAYWESASEDENDFSRSGKESPHVFSEDFSRYWEETTTWRRISAKWRRATRQLERS